MFIGEHEAFPAGVLVVAGRLLAVSFVTGAAGLVVMTSNPSSLLNLRNPVVVVVVAVVVVVLDVVGVVVVGASRFRVFLRKKKESRVEAQRASTSLHLKSFS